MSEPPTILLLKENPLTQLERNQAERIGLLLVTIVYYVGGYFLLSMFNEHRSYYYNVALPFEANTPFIPAGAIPYSLVFANVVLGFFSVPLENGRLFRMGVKLMAIDVTISFLLFYAVPVRAVNRPMFMGDGSFVGDLAAMWFWVDKPTNLFPSLHVTVACLGALFAYLYTRWLGVLTTLIALGVAIGALVMHQHYLADVVAGASLAGGSFWWGMRQMKKLEQS